MRQFRGSALQFLAEVRIEIRFSKCCHAAAAIEESLLDLIGCGSFAPCLLQLRHRCALQIEETTALLRIGGLLARQPRAERAERGEKDEHGSTRHHSCSCRSFWTTPAPERNAAIEVRSSWCPACTKARPRERPFVRVHPGWTRPSRGEATPWRGASRASLSEVRRSRPPPFRRRSIRR